MSLTGNQTTNIGLLLLRVGIVAMFMVHGVPKLLDGPEMWEKLGQAMGVFGITFAPGFWGFMAAFAEAVGGLALIVGLLTRPFAVLLLITMIVAAGMHLSQGDGIKGSAHAIEAGVVFLALIFTGAGQFSLGRIVPGMKWLS